MITNGGWKIGAKPFEKIITRVCILRIYSLYCCIITTLVLFLKAQSADYT